MPKLTGPIFSLEAKKSLKKTLAYQNRAGGSAVTKYSKPGSVNSFTPSAGQHNQRGLIGTIITRWQSMTTDERAVYESLAESYGQSLSGYHYFVKVATENPLAHLGLRAYWGMNELAGVNIPDISKNGFTGTLKPTPPGDCPLPVSSKNAKFGSALNFDHIDDDIEFTTIVISRLNASFSLWFKTKTNFSTNYNNIAALLSYTGVASRYFGIAGNGSGPYTLIGECNTNGDIMCNVAGIVPVGKWNHVLVNFSTGTATTYLNNVLVGTRAIISDFSPGRIGGITEVGGNNYFGGQMDEIRIYNRPLGATERTKLFRLFSR